MVSVVRVACGEREVENYSKVVSPGPLSRVVLPM